MSAAALHPRRDDPAFREGLAWSLGAHGMLLLLVLFGSYLLPGPRPAVPLGIQATVVDARTLERRTRPDPAAEARRQAEAEAARRRLAEEQATQEREAEQRQQQQAEAQRRKEQEARQQAEQQQQARAREEAQAKAAMERRKAEAAAKAEAQRKATEQAAAEQAAADKAAAEKRRQAEAARQREAADLARMLAEEEALLAATDSGALNDYMNLINQKVKRNWNKPLSARPGVECEVTVTQIPGGEVTDVQIGRCNGDDALRRSVELAFRKASPLPLPDDPSLFKRNLKVLFKPEE